MSAIQLDNSNYSNSQERLETQLYAQEQDISSLRKEIQQLSKAKRDAEKKLIAEVKKERKRENCCCTKVNRFLCKLRTHVLLYSLKIMRMINQCGSKEKPTSIIRFGHSVSITQTNHAHLELLEEEVSQEPLWVS